MYCCLWCVVCSGASLDWQNKHICWEDMTNDGSLSWAVSHSDLYSTKLNQIKNTVGNNIKYKKICPMLCLFLWLVALYWSSICAMSSEFLVGMSRNSMIEVFTIYSKLPISSPSFIHTKLESEMILGGLDNFNFNLKGWTNFEDNELNKDGK